MENETIKQGTEGTEKKEYLLTEADIFNVKSVAKKRTTFGLIQLITVLVLVLFCVFPLINVNLILAEQNVSVLDVMISTPPTEVAEDELEEGIKEEIAASLAADYFGIPLEDYEGFSSAIMTGCFRYAEDLTAGVVIKNVLRILSFFALAFVLIKGIIEIVPCIKYWNVEGALRFATADTLKKFPVHESYAKEKGLKPKQVIKRKDVKRIKVDSLSSLIDSCFALYFPFSLLSHLQSVELVKVNPLLTIVMVLTMAVLIGAIACEGYYCVKYAHTIANYKRLKDIVR